MRGGVLYHGKNHIGCLDQAFEIALWDCAGVLESLAFRHTPVTVVEGREAVRLGMLLQVEGHV